jgi:LL-diaminopimelate aminotransferase
MTHLTTYLPAHAQRLDRLPPYKFAVIGQRIQELTASGHDIIRLDIGSPDFPPSDTVIQALQKSAENPSWQSYGSYRGDSGFRKAVAGYYQNHFGVTLDSFHEVIPLIGSKEGLINMTLAYIDQGDGAIVPDIGYPAYSMGVLMAGGTVIYTHLDAENHYLIDFDALERTLMTTDVTPKLLWVNYPNNPTGATADRAFFEQAVAFCMKHHLLLCSDNPYNEIVFDGYVAPSVLQIPGAKDCAVEFFSVSKTYNMAGMRLGACVGNAEALDQLITIKSNIDTGHYKPIYDAGTTAITTTTPEWIAARNKHYERRRDMLLQALPEIGLEADLKPAATLYVWARVLEGDEDLYCEDALNHADVAMAPGTVYGPGGKGFVRLSVTVKDDQIATGLDRLRKWYKNR